MADMNILANDAPAEQAPDVTPPTSMDDQIFPSSKWCPSARRFWDTMCFNSSTGLYNCQLDEQWFNLYKDILRDALDITPTNDNSPYVAPPLSDTVIEYVNTFGYPNTLRNVSAMSVNALYQPWRAILSMINMCLTSKTARYDRPRHLVLQILWGIIHRFVIDYAERILEEFVQSIQTFLPDRKNLTTASHENKNPTHLLIPSVRFTKLIIHHLKTKHNIHPRTSSPLYYSHEEYVLNTLKFVGKDSREIFGMPIPDALLTDEIKGASYYGKYQEHVAKRTSMPTKASRHVESPSLDVELALTDSEIESDNVVPKINIGDQDEGQAGPNPDLLQYNLALEERLDKHGSRLYKLDNLNIPHREILQQRMFEDKSYKAHEDHKNLYDVLHKSLERDYSNQLLSDLEEARQRKRKRRDLPRTPSGPPPLQPPLHLLQQVHLVLQITSNTRYESASVSGTQKLSPTDSLIQDDTIHDEQVHLSDDEDSGNNYLQKADSRKDWQKPLPKEERPATLELAWTIPSSNVSDVENNWATALVLAYETPAENSLLAKTRDMTNFLNWYCQQVDKTKLTQADLEGKAYEVVKAFYPDVIYLQFQMEEYLEYLRYGSNGSSPALSISKMKVASYPDFGLKLLMSEQIWIDDMCTYDISAKYGFSHWWFNRQKFYIDRYDSLPRQKEVRSHMRFLSVVRIKAYLRYGDFEDLNLLLLQGHLGHLPGSDKQMLSTAVKLWTRTLVIRQLVEDFQLVVFPIKNNKRKIMRFNEIYKFSDGTLTRILEALAYRVKEFKIKQAIEDEKDLPELGMLC
nr:hypothetical protein [Tanacetum cinerariifolium]